MELLLPVLLEEELEELTAEEEELPLPADERTVVPPLERLVLWLCVPEERVEL